MILRALYDYYNRCKEYDPDSVPQYGKMNAAISFIIVISKDGTFVRLEDTRKEDGKGRTYVLPMGVHTNSISPFIFWDKCMYVIDYSNVNKPLSDKDQNDENKLAKQAKSIKSAHEKHLAFVERCKRIASHLNDPELDAVVAFYEKNQLLKLRNDELWDELYKNLEVNVTFRIVGNTSVVASKPELIQFIEKDSEEIGICLVTGKKTDIIRKSTPTPINGCKASASLVSFQKDSGYDSYGKKQGYNAPISLEAEFAYSTALKKLIAKESKNCFSIGYRKILFWPRLMMRMLNLLKIIFSLCLGIAIIPIETSMM